MISTQTNLECQNDAPRSPGLQNSVCVIAWACARITMWALRYHGMEFAQVVLNRCPGQNYTPTRLKIFKHLVCFSLRRFESMSLIADYEVNLRAKQLVQPLVTGADEYAYKQRRFSDLLLFSDSGSVSLTILYFTSKLTPLIWGARTQ